jgi:glycosyltransferase involved in cell wall biosynthesis
MTRVLLVHQPVDGGVGRHVADLCTGLTRAGHQVVLCGPSVPAGAPPGCEHIPLALSRAVSPRADLAAVARLRSIVRRVRPDILHAHSSKAGAVARIARATGVRVPVVYTPHGFAFAGYFQRDAERSLYRAAELVLTPLAARIVGVCEAEAELARRLGFPGRVRVVHNGVAPAEAGVEDPQMAQLRRAGPVICTLTQLRPGKGLETLIDAMPAVLEAQPRVQLAIWGDGPDLETLGRRARSAGVGPAVHFLGSTRDPVSVLRTAGVFVLPSEAEAFPYVILEAMSTARPIVASDVGGISEALAAGDAGRLVPPGDVGRLAGALVDLLGNAAQAAALGDRARRRANACFSIERMLNGTASVYAELLG